MNKAPLCRLGAATVEFAVVLPVFILFLVGSVELGRAVMVQHMLEEAARAGCRVAVFEGSTTEDVEDIVDAAMLAGNVEGYSIEVSPDPPINLDAFEPVTVTITVPYDSVAFLGGQFMGGKTLAGVCVMPAEGDGANDPDGVLPPTTKKKNKGKKGKKGKKSKSKNKNKNANNKNKKASESKGKKKK